MHLEVEDAFTSRGPLPGFAPRLAEHPIGEGGFGQVFEAEDINGAPPTEPTLVKLFREPGIAAELHANLRDLLTRVAMADSRRADVALPPLRAAAGLAALPEVVFRAKADGAPVVGLSMPRLDVLGFQPLTRLARLSPSVQTRVAWATKLVEAVATLHVDLGFTHADLTPDNVFVSLDTSDLALIDFDGGAPRGRAALALGKLGPYLAPELVAQQTSEASQTSDTWSLAVMVGALLLGAHPLAFLRDLMPDTLHAYAVAHRWPERPDRALLCDDGEALHGHVERAVEDLDPHVAALLARTLGPGAMDPRARPDARLWRSAFRLQSAAPRFATLVLEPRVQLIGAPMELSWDAEGAERVWLTGVDGALPARGSFRFRAPPSCLLELRAENVFGVAAEALALIGLPTPELRTAAMRPPHAP